VAAAQWLKREIKPTVRHLAGWGAVVCPSMLLLAISGIYETDWKFITATVVGFVLCLALWIALAGERG
jgi:hypothetical protein